MYIRRSLIMLLLIVLSLPLVMFRRANQLQATSTDIQLSDLQLYQVQNGDVALTVSGIGAVEADKQISLTMQVGGAVAEIYVQRDDYVLAGDTLLRVENESQRIAYEQALISLEHAELNYDDLLTVDETAIQIAASAVETARGAYYSAVSAVSSAEIEAAELAYQQALAAAEALREERDRIGGQFGGDSIEWTQANARYGEATFQAEIARLRSERLRTASYPQAASALARIAEAEAELERVRAGATESEFDAAEIQIEQALNQVERAETAYNRTILTAPFDGVVTAVNAQQGGLIAPGLALIELTDISPLGLTVQVDEIDIGLVEVGQPVRVMLDALPEIEIPATVTEIAPVGTPSGGIVSYDVSVALDGEDSRVRVGMTAEASIIIEEAQDVLVVPNLYIRRERATGKNFVNVLRPDDQLEEVEIEVGIQGRESSEVVSGLAQGDIVVIDLSGRGVDLFGGS